MQKQLLEVFGTGQNGLETENKHIWYISEQIPQQLKIFVTK